MKLLNSCLRNSELFFLYLYRVLQTSPRNLPLSDWKIWPDQQLCNLFLPVMLVNQNYQSMWKVHVQYVYIHFAINPCHYGASYLCNEIQSSSCSKTSLNCVFFHSFCPAQKYLPSLVKISVSPWHTNWTVLTRCLIYSKKVPILQNMGLVFYRTKADVTYMYSEWSLLSSAERHELNWLLLLFFFSRYLLFDKYKFTFCNIKYK